ncbi:MAG: 50S ribosomal protein L5 [Candidatus Omnitrophica bacterium CG11_big_fil_rev_8_21_14_0_20_45_26]|uniref:Large ribosomal subunit protein uL5 n=1 Tax=Candidatus Abzuiibacterium crystallinum TaxID=1974748 RepID=A0A2H0LNH6_9BACT|nr:MAG: 50S ribosomal protein L5 [Candidatus Omnitrophica bacterium CG11_big_fil_rev_8_21_14_0_20_45_26]PIW65115.1 MAG: 50S ribosomal protein L5 [Candidatus Omnitrophica bacterium CG12_big_fil_rev_8_21_14_0_65_45_16]
MPRLLKKYREEIVVGMKKQFGYENVMQVPHLEKVVINMGVKEGAQDIKILDQIALELSQIVGQKPVVTRAKKSISSFHLREGAPIGLKVTLRKSRMYEFIDRLFNVAMPRIRDFRGYSNQSFDSNGNYTLGIQEQIIFPEIQFDKIKKVQGMDVTFVTSTNHTEEAKQLLQMLGLPFKK